MSKSKWACTLAVCFSQACVFGGSESADETFHGDVRFTAEERAEIEAAFEEWRTFSGGAVNRRVVFDLLYQWQTHKNTILKETKDEGSSLGWTDVGQRHEVEITLNVGKTDLNDLKWVTAHEIGHAVGLFWPECQAGSSDSKCWHVADEKSVMHSHYNGQAGFTAEDLKFCVAAGVCRR